MDAALTLTFGQVITNRLATLENAYLTAQLTRRKAMGKGVPRRSTYAVADFGCGDAVSLLQLLLHSLAQWQDQAHLRSCTSAMLAPVARCRCTLSEALFAVSLI